MATWVVWSLHWFEMILDMTWILEDYYRAEWYSMKLTTITLMMDMNQRAFINGEEGFRGSRILHSGNPNDLFKEVLMEV